MIIASEDMNIDEYDDFIRTLECYYGCYVITGTLGLWDGVHEIYPDVQMTMKYVMNKCVNNEEFIFEQEDDGSITITVIHHDGRNIFNIHELTAQGYRLYDDMDSDIQQIMTDESNYENLPLLH